MLGFRVYGVYGTEGLGSRVYGLGSGGFGNSGSHSAILAGHWL